MRELKNLGLRLVREEGGAAASEYAILVAAIALAVSLAVTQFNLGDIFKAVSDKVKGLIG